MNPYIFQGAMKGFSEASDTLLQVSLKKRQLEKEDKEFNIGMKMKKLQLEALEEKMSPEQLEYNKTLQGLEMKGQKLKTEKATLDLNKARTEAEVYQKVMDSYLEGAEQGEADGLREGFELGGQQYDLDMGAVTGLPIKRVTPTQRLKEEKATEELDRRKATRQPLDTQIPQPAKSGWFGIGGEEVSKATTTFAETIKTRQDLINMIQNVDALEEQGVDISKLEDLYNDELLKLTAEGYLSEK